MQKVVLIFPNTSSIADFITKYHVSRAQVDSLEQSLSAPLQEDEISSALADFDAILYPKPIKTLVEKVSSKKIVRALTCCRNKYHYCST